MITAYDTAISLSSKYLRICNVLKSAIQLEKPANAIFIQACIFERLCDGLQSANAIMKLMQKGMDVENSLGLILRCACADMLTTLYLNSIKDEQQLFQVTSQILFGNILRDRDYVNFLIKEKILTPEFGQHINNIAATYEKEFQEKFNKKFEDISTAQMHRRLRSGGFRQVSKLFDFYTYYSKYEHFSKTTYSIQRANAQHRQKYTVEILDNIFFCLKLISLNGMFKEHPHLNVYINNLNHLPFISNDAYNPKNKPK